MLTGDRSIEISSSLCKWGLLALNLYTTYQFIQIDVCHRSIQIINTIHYPLFTIHYSLFTIH